MICCTFQAKAQEKVIVKGYMIDESTFEAVPLANILISNTQTRYISNRSGMFHINITTSDTIYITGIGYGQKKFIGSEIIPQNHDDTIRIYLRPTVYKLKEVMVTNNHKRDSIARLAAEYLKTDPLQNNYDRIINRPKGGFMSPLTAMYEAWSKNGLEMQKFEDFLHYAEMQKEVDKRYNRKVIKQISGLDETDLDDFILFCKIDRQFILSSPDYDLYLAIKECADNFKGRKNRERNKLK
jgi:hypothetical protein